MSTEPLCIGYDILPYFYTPSSVGMRTWVNHRDLREKPGINFQMTLPKIGLLRQAMNCHFISIIQGTAVRSHRCPALAVPLCILEGWPMN